MTCYELLVGTFSGVFMRDMHHCSRSFSIVKRRWEHYMKYCIDNDIRDTIHHTDNMTAQHECIWLK
jgi:hypothetical protein